MAKPTIAFCMISKDKADIIERALNSTQGIFDIYCLQDTGSTDNTVEVFTKWCEKNGKRSKVSCKVIGKDYKSVVVDGRELLGDFASARNDSFKLAKGYDYAFWMDTDDILVNGERILQAVVEMEKRDIGMAIMTYVYARSADGLKPVVQKRERIIDLRVQGEWIDRVHETYAINKTAIEIDGVYVEHLRSTFEAIGTGRRNNLIMVTQLQEDGLDKFSDKMLHNLAFDHWEHREFDKAIEYYSILVNRLVGTPQVDVVYNSLIKMAYAYLCQNDLENAIVYALKATRQTPHVPTAEPYITLAQAYGSMGNWNEASMYAKIVIEQGIPNTPAPINEYDFLIVPRKILEQAYLVKGDFDAALQMADEILKISPSAASKQEKQNIKNEHNRQNAIKGILSLAKYAQSHNDVQMLDRIKTAVPLELKDDNMVRGMLKELTEDYKRKAHPTKLQGVKSIVIYAGQHYETWDGNSDKEGGIGGSEGMCIQMAKELVKLGNKVFVYNECAEDKVIDGVEYIHHSKWSETIRCDVFISLRRPDIFSRIIRAKKQYLWLHDTEYGDRLETAHFYAPNKVIVLSEAHKEIIQTNHGVADDRIFYISRNALNAEAIKYADEKKDKRNPYQVIYASSYDRGLDKLLEIWPKIKEAVPEATLKIFYGWNGFDKMMEARKGTPQGDWMTQYKNKIIGMLTSLAPYGVQECGRISQNELYKEFAESGIWAYPTSFYEISCINAMTAQTMGCIPVVSNYAALKETVSGEYGIKAELNDVQEAMIYVLTNQEEMDKRRKPMIKWAREKFDMESLAKDWDKFFNED